MNSSSLRFSARIRRKILVKSGGNLFQSTVEIGIQRRYYRRDFLALHRFGLRVEMGPDDFARLAVIELKLHRHKPRDAGPVHFLKVEELAADNKLRGGIAAQAGDRFIIPAGAQY